MTRSISPSVTFVCVTPTGSELFWTCTSKDCAVACFHLFLCQVAQAEPRLPVESSSHSTDHFLICAYFVLCSSARMYSIEPYKIFVYCLTTSLLVEFLNWLIVYRTPNFQRVKSELLTTVNKLERLRAEGKDDHDKQVKRCNEAIFRMQQVLWSSRMITIVSIQHHS